MLIMRDVIFVMGCIGLSFSFLIAYVHLANVGSMW